MRAIAVAIAAAIVLAATVATAAPATKSPIDSLPPAPGERRIIVGILDVRFDGMSKSAETEFERQLESVMTDAARERFWIATRRRMEAMLAGSTGWMKGCATGPCMKVVRSQTRAELALTVYLQGFGTTYRYLITLIRTDTGAVVDQRTESCAACTQSEAITQATTAILELVLGAPNPDQVKDPSVPDPAEENARMRAKARIETAKRRNNRTALVLLGLGAVAGGIGGYALSRDEDAIGGPALGLAAGLAVSSVTVFVVNLTWD